MKTPVSSSTSPRYNTRNSPIKVNSEVHLLAKDKDFNDAEDQNIGSVKRKGSKGSEQKSKKGKTASSSTKV